MEMISWLNLYDLRVSSIPWIFEYYPKNKAIQTVIYTPSIILYIQQKYHCYLYISEYLLQKMFISEGLSIFKD